MYVSSMLIRISSFNQSCLCSWDDVNTVQGVVRGELRYNDFSEVVVNGAACTEQATHEALDSVSLLNRYHHTGTAHTVGTGVQDEVGDGYVSNTALPGSRNGDMTGHLKVVESLEKRQNSNAT